MDMINNFIGISENQTINYNRDIVARDLNGNDTIVVKCYCTIVKGKSISYYMDVLDKSLYENIKDMIQEEITKFKTQAEQIAKQNNVPII